METLHQVKMSMRAHLACGAAAMAIACLCIAMLAVSSPPSLARDAAGNMCWAPDSLPGKRNEHIIRKRIPSAFVLPPKGMPSRAMRPLREDLRGAIRRVDLPPGKKLIALTFDLCEQPHEVAGYQGDIVDFLRKNNIKSTFFIGGKWLATHPTRGQQLMADPLFEIANHTWDHRNLRLLSKREIANEIEYTQAAYEKQRRALISRQCMAPSGQRVTGEFLSKTRAPPKMRLFRFPFGACTKEALDTVNDHGLLAIQWDLSSADPWRGMTANKMVATVTERAKPGSIVLFHANGRGWHTGRAIPKIIANLKSKGYAFVTVGELLNAGKPVISATCFDAKPGDTNRYDKLSKNLEVIYRNAQSENDRRRKSKKSSDKTSKTNSGKAKDDWGAILRRY